MIAAIVVGAAADVVAVVDVDVDADVDAVVDDDDVGVGADDARTLVEDPKMSLAMEPMESRMKQSCLIYLEDV